MQKHHLFGQRVSELSVDDVLQIRRDFFPVIVPVKEGILLAAVLPKSNQSTVIQQSDASGPRSKVVFLIVVGLPHGVFRLCLSLRQC